MIFKKFQKSKEKKRKVTKCKGNGIFSEKEKNQLISGEIFLFFLLA